MNTRNKFMSATEAVKLIKDHDTIALVGGGGGLMEASHVFQAVEKRFLETAQPRNLTVVHALGIGDKRSEGLNRFAHEGLIKRVIGGHWVWSPRMQQLARDEKIEAYVFPSGCCMQLYREIGGGRPGLFTHVGLGTFVDPRHGGGKMNASATEDLIELSSIAGKELLCYKSFPINVTIIRGSFGDADGNISLDQEAANLDIYAAALAAHNSGGIVIAQVRSAVDVNSMPARSVRIPGAIVDAVVVDSEQRMGYDLVYDPTISGEVRGPLVMEPPETMTIRKVIAKRAEKELVDGAIINFGVGIGEGVAKIIANKGAVDRYYQTIEHGTYGGSLLVGTMFGYARGASCMIDGPSQFDFYAGGGLDLAFLGFGELDAAGDVNVSRLGGLTVGPGGFIDIAQNAKKVVFCGTFDTKGSKIAVSDAGLEVMRQGDVRKLVQKVEQITYSGIQALKRGHRAIYITERAVFELSDVGLVLTEIAPGVDLQRDILDQMAFAPLMPKPPKLMDADCFADEDAEAML